MGPDIEESTESDTEGGESVGKRIKREAQINFQQAAKLAAMEGVWSFEEASRIGSIRKHPVYGEQLLRKKINKKVWELFIHKVDVYLSSMLTDYSELTFNEKRIYWDQFANPGFGIEGVEDVLVSTTRLIRLIDFNFADPQTFLQDCLSWFNNTEIKRRTLVFVGPADSFKSWIARLSMVLNENKFCPNLYVYSIMIENIKPRKRITRTTTIMRTNFVMKRNIEKCINFRTLGKRILITRIT